MLEWQPCTQPHHSIRRFYKSLLLKSWDTAGNTNISHCCDGTTNLFFPSVGNCTVCLLSVFQKSSFRECCNVAVCTKMSLLIFALPKCILLKCGSQAENTDTALSISIEPLNKDVFGIGGLVFCHKL